MAIAAKKKIAGLLKCSGGQSGIAKKKSQKQNSRRERFG
jgi:hypothetical protein